MIENEIPKLCARPQSLRNSCLYPRAARTASSSIPAFEFVLTTGSAILTDRSIDRSEAFQVLFSCTVQHSNKNSKHENSTEGGCRAMYGVSKHARNPVTASPSYLSAQAMNMSCIYLSPPEQLHSATHSHTHFLPCRRWLSCCSCDCSTLSASR